MKKQSVYSLGSLLLLVVLFVALTMIAGSLFKGFRFDLTENRLFTLSEGTGRILENLEEPVTLYFYFSQDASREIPAVRAYAKRVDEMLEEMVNRSGGMLTIRRVDPRPFSEEEDEAAAFGLQAAPESVAQAADQAPDTNGEAAPEEQSGGGLTNNIGIIVLGVAGVLVLLAGTGVFLLRRG